MPTWIRRSIYFGMDNTLNLVSIYIWKTAELTDLRVRKAPVRRLVGPLHQIVGPTD